MKPTRYTSALLAICLSGVASASLLAQDATPPPAPPAGPRPPADHGRPPHHPPPPLMEALDTDHDGILSANEISNAAVSLRTLDKNGDGKLTEDELRPPPPPRDQSGPPPRGQRRPGDQSRNDDGPQPPDGPSVAHQHPHGPPPAPDELDADGPPDGPDGHAARRPGPPFAARAPLSESDPVRENAAPHAPASARAQRPPPPRLDDDPVAARLQARGTVAAERPGQSGIAQSPLFELLDANHDGILSETEKQTALDVLQGLDQPGPDRRHRDGFRPPPPDGRVP